MNNLTRMWLTWKHARKFTRVGRHFRCPVADLEVAGNVEVGDDCRFRNGVVLRAHPGGRIVFGNRTGCSWHVVMEARESIRINDYAGIAEHCVFDDTVYQMVGEGKDWRFVPQHTEPIVVGHSCFIGSGCFIGPGVSIGEGAVVASHSVVTRSVGDYEIWGGAPARKVGHRTEGVPESRLEEFRKLVEAQGLQQDRYKA